MVPGGIPYFDYAKDILLIQLCLFVTEADITASGWPFSLLALKKILQLAI